VNRVPRWAWILGSLVLLLVVVALAVPYLLDVNRYKAVIAAEIEQATGRKVALGTLRARLLPTVGFVVDDFALGNPRGFAEGNLLTAESIRGTLAVGPLLRREFQLTSVEIVRPHLYLMEDDRGQVNYELEAPKKPAAAKKTSAPGVTVVIDSIEVTDAQLTMARVTGSRRKIVPALRAREIDVTLSDVALDAKRLKDWKAEAPLSGVVLELSGLKPPVEFRSGSIELRQGALESKFEVAAGDVGRASGTLRVKDVEKAVATFDLKTSLLDLDALIAATTKTETVPATPSRGRRSDLLAQGRLAADRVRWAGYEATGATAEVRIYGDRMEVWPVKAAVYGGVLQVSGRVDTRQVPERFSSNIQLTDLDVGKLMAASPDTRGKMTGTARLNLQVFGALGGDIANSLTGAGDLAVRDGRFPGFSMGKLGALARVQQFLSLGQSGGGAGGELTYTSIAGDLKIGGGRVASDRIHVESSSGTIDLRGSFGLDQTLSYEGQANLTRSASGGQSPTDALFGVIGGVTKQNLSRLSIPFSIRGTFSDPKVGPGRGLPQFATSAPADTSGQQADTQQKKRSILDIFKRP
jgi:AsmA protein